MSLISLSFLKVSILFCFFKNQLAQFLTDVADSLLCSAVSVTQWRKMSSFLGINASTESQLYAIQKKGRKVIHDIFHEETKNLLAEWNSFYFTKNRSISRFEFYVFLRLKNLRGIRDHVTQYFVRYTMA